jgi:Ca2+-transporting ATPase
MSEEIGPSRHLTFIFTAFVFMQIFNMITARKIHDEWNILEGIHKNMIFVVIWFVICGGQVIITQFGGLVFVCCEDGLDGVQWAMAIVVGLTSIVINFLLKLIPDGCCPLIGQDTVDEKRIADKKAKALNA